jgi:hemerythrin-like metal-binding protein
MPTKPVNAWNPAYVVQLPTVDEQHKGLFDLAYEVDCAAFAGRDDRFLDEALNRLLTYCRNHFNHEEELMAKAGYPGLHAHRLLHDDFTRAMLEFREQKDAGMRGVARNITSYLKQWFTEHIAQEDRKFAAHVHQQ